MSEHAPALGVLIADDHPAIISTVSTILEEAGYEVVGSATDGVEAEALIRELHPQIAILDLRMPGKTGFEVARAVGATSPQTAVVIYTGFADQGLLAEAVDLNVMGFVSKASPVEDLVRAVAAAAQGEAFVDPLVGGAIVTAPESANIRLTPRERDVLRQLAKGFTNAEIGRELFISAETVRTHVRKATAKLGARNRVEAVVNAFRLGLIS